MNHFKQNCSACAKVLKKSTLVLIVAIALSLVSCSTMGRPQTIVIIDNDTLVETVNGQLVNLNSKVKNK